MSHDTPQTPHGPVEQVLPDLFIVRGSFRMAPLVRIPRTMCVVRRGRALTVLNAVRVSPEVEAGLAALGEVRHVVRLGHLHGCDDAWTVRRHGARYWSLPGERVAGAEPTDAIVDGESPLPGASFIVLRGARLPEAALLLPDEGGSLITCDAVQNVVDDAFASSGGALVARALGFRRPCGVVPMWRLRQGGRRLAPDFDRLLQRPFENLVSGHGPACLGDAHARVAAEVGRLWPRLPHPGARQALERARVCWNRGDLDGYVRALYSPNARLWSNGHPIAQGHAQIRAFYGPMFTGEAPTTLVFDDVVGDEDLAVRFHLEAHGGAPVAAGLTLLRFDEGGVAERWTHTTAAPASAPGSPVVK
ncbi:MAG: nuclear transport factor 2 family protein [Alphaproteobacteria bacterium]|nr:nuclear transport factor 2 family protein [Alphaproteobacteria bacterium]MCB9791094.1 nuclear transport factor 2 family protein [Alphaproteobacteria bacterium]